MSRKHFIVLGLFLAVGFLFLSASTVKAATYTWTGDGDGHTWTDGPNWGVGSGPNAYPGATSTDDVIIGLSTGNVVPTIYATTSLGFGLTSLTLGDAGKGPVLVIGNGATLNASTTVMVVGTSTLKLGDATWGSGTLRLGNGASGATPLSIGSSATFVTSTSTVTYTAAFNGGAPGSSIFIATTTYYNLNLTPTSTTGTFTFVNNGNATTTNMTISSAAQFNAATFVVSGTLTVNSGGVLDGVGGNITFSGSGTPFVNNGTFKADGGTVQYTSASATNIATGTYANLTISGAATKTLLANTTATSTLTLTTSGDVLDGAGFTLTLSGSGTPLTKTSGNGTFQNIPTITYSSASATNIATGTYANLELTGAAIKTLLGATTATSTVTVGAGATLDGGGSTLTLSGSGTPFVNNGTFKADGGTVQYTSALATNIATGTYANLELTGAAIKTLLGNTTATSTVTVPSGATLAVSTYTFTATGATWTNSGIVTEGTGGKIVHASASAFTDSSGTAKSFFSENNGDSVYLTVTDTSLNFDASTAESVTGTATISASSDTSSTETITLTETGIKTGIFRGGARLASISSNFPGILECFGSVTLSALFTDSQETDTSTPSSATGLCANGGGGGGSSAVAATTVTTATTATTTATTTAATTTPVVTATSTATAVSTLETVQTKVASVIAKIAALPTNPTTSDLASIQAEIAAILIELQSIQAAQPTPQGVALGFNFVRPLALGLRHADVSNLQQALKTDSSVYPEGLVTGYFGSMTLKAVQKFQEKYSIASPGVPGYGNVGPKTRTKLNELYGGK